MDLDSAEGREALRRAQDLLHERLKARIAEQARQYRSEAPSAAFEIPPALYAKAAEHQDQLTDDERRQLHSRGDLLGRALAEPKSLTVEERYQVLLWPPPDVVRERILRASNGACSTPAELFARARAGEASGFKNLSDEELSLMVTRFGYRDQPRYRSSLFGELGASTEVPGNMEAMNLLWGRETGAQPRLLLALSQHQTGGPRVNVWGDPGNPAMAAAATVAGPSLFGTDIPPDGAASGSEGGDQALLEDIATRMADLVDRLDRGVLPEDEFKSQTRAQITALCAFVARTPRAGRPHPYQRTQQQQPPTTVTTTSPQPTLPSWIVAMAAAAGEGAAGGAAAEGVTPPPPPPIVPLPKRVDGRNIPHIWPPGQHFVNAMNLFVKDLQAKMGVESLTSVFKDYGQELTSRWEALSKTERVAYAEKAEALRLQAWTDYLEKK